VRVLLGILAADLDVEEPVGNGSSCSSVNGGRASMVANSLVRSVSPRRDPDGRRSQEVSSTGDDL